LPFLAWLLILGLFFYDATVTLIRRILNGDRWREGHRLHAYQRVVPKVSGHGHALISGLVLLMTVPLAGVAWWLRETGLPLPLGGNVVRRDLGSILTTQVAADLKASIEYALANRVPALAHASRFNRGISEEKTDRFVGMYVNDWTVDYGPRGRQAVQLLLDRAHTAGIIPRAVQVEFVG
jgi:hypothetical protein